MKLSRWAKGGKPKSQSNAEKGWLLPAEVNKVIEYAVEIGNGRGIPLKMRGFEGYWTILSRVGLI